MKDHEIRELVNKLTDVAREYGQTQQLRERIARVVKDAVPREKQVARYHCNKCGYVGEDGPLHDRADLVRPVRCDYYAGMIRLVTKESE